MKENMVDLFIEALEALNPKIHEVLVPLTKIQHYLEMKQEKGFRINSDEIRF